MKHIRKILSIAALLAIMLMIQFGNTNQASAIEVLPFVAPYYIDQTPATPITATQINQYSELHYIYTPIIFTSSGSFSFAEEVMLGGTSAPRPGPRGEPGDALTQQLIYALSYGGYENGGDLVMLGGTSAPRPGPRGDWYSIGWSSNATFVNGDLDLANLSVWVDSYDFLQPGQGLAVFGAADGFKNLASVELTGDQAGSFMFLDDPDAAFIVRVPEPSTMLLVGIGLFGLAVVGIRWRKKTAAQ